MSNIIISNKPESVISMEVAKMVNKEHSKLMRDIRRYINQLNEAKIGLVDFFEESTYIDTKGEARPCFNVTRKGCEFIAHKMTSQKGTEFTARYVNRFHELEEDNVTNALINALSSISESMTNMKNDINNRLTKLEEHSQLEQQHQIETTYKKPYNPWVTKMQPKYKLLEEYFDIKQSNTCELSHELAS